MDDRIDLGGLRVLITRPAHQAEATCAMIEKYGGIAHRFPVLEILPPQNPEAADSIISRLDRFDIAIFISPNAVTYGCNLIKEPAKALQNIKIAAIGKGTSKVLTTFGITTDIITANRYDSETLLQTPELQAVKGKKIVIFRGEGGRELIANTLRQRGALIECAEVYRRTCPEKDTHCLRKLKIDMIVVTSNESLHNIFNMTTDADKPWLLSKPLVVFSQRTAQLAKSLGFIHTAAITRVASDEGLIETLNKNRHMDRNNKATL